MSWQDRAACRNTVTRGVITGPNADPFFPKGNRQLTQLGLAYCAVCPVQTACETQFQTMPAKIGVWAGKVHDRGEVRPLTSRTDTGVAAYSITVRDFDRVQYSADMNRRRHALYTAGLTDQAIAATENVTRSGVAMWRRRLALPANAQPKPGLMSVTERRREWHSLGWTDQQMADRERVLVATVRRWRERQHLPGNRSRELNQRAG